MRAGQRRMGSSSVRKPCTSTPARRFRRSRQADAGLRAFLDGAGRTRLDRHGERCAGFRREVLHGRGQLGSRREQHPGLLHPGRHEIPGFGACRQTRAALRDATGRVCARHVLGLCLTDAGDHAHVDVGDVRSRDSTQLPHHAGVRRAHLPPGQQHGEIALRQVSLDTARRHALTGVGRGGQDFRG